ncbi:hypothetical protein RUM43_005627 [Polyplax serrata]|uniref:Uncharacterized protein n=1 Tax=Polyplax serrata TaxID=468196 RepID=A0AAN8S2Z9_POLSC
MQSKGARTSLIHVVISQVHPLGSVQAHPPSKKKPQSQHEGECKLRGERSELNKRDYEGPPPLASTTIPTNKKNQVIVVEDEYKFSESPKETPVQQKRALHKEAVQK